MHRRKSATLFGSDFTIHEVSEKGVGTQDIRRRNSFIISEPSLLPKPFSPNSDLSFAWIDDCCRELKDQLMVSMDGGNDPAINVAGGNRRRNSTETEVNTDVHGPFGDPQEQLAGTVLAFSFKNTK